MNRRDRSDRRIGLTIVKTICLHDRDRIEAFLRRDAFLNVYQLGDLELKTVEHVGLNVKADNRPAIACYQKLGFEIVGAYEEYSVDPL